MKLFDLLQELCNEYDSIKTVKQSVQESIKTRRGALLKGDSKHYLLHPSFPVDIRQEVYNGTGGNKTKFYRLFCFSLHDPSWSKVGWILPGELQNCMLCNCCIAASHWSFQHSKLHCYCCGNVFCKNCISGTKELMLDTNSNDCQQLGWICKLCDYGQVSFCVKILLSIQSSFNI